MTKEINWLEKIQETATFLKEKVGGEMPKVAIVLGSGLGNLAEKIDVKIAIPYSEIPNFPVSTVEGHKGQLIFGKLGKKYVMAMQGRFHYYEGYSMKEATFPIRVMKAIGVKVLCVSNAAGGMNPDFRVGDVMLITDHINLFPDHPLRGKNYNELGPRFPAMNEAYSHRILDLARKIAKKNKVRLMEGVYVGTQGPTFETPSEYRYFYRIGGDAVGMSTVPEVIVARHADMDVFGLSVITDLGGEGIFVDVSHEEVQQAATKAEPIMTLMVTEVINNLDEV
ncbi:MAG: purine-nucleoside phosphorylase [Muribaculaceae bacterium]|nr:purine-nucleoside phosphorylase [Muribaculaceae bacterium]MBR5117716.1 purine-nucleoside phosphorylase [Muribaculaceae bacterium]MBR5171427.1 purine-nucleoside phosphorylase [Muribaculaceae bacterium]